MALRADRVGVRQDQVDIHGRVTSPSFLNDLLESLPEWTDMPVWVNGTEELLPSNNSVPVTSPILADIAYPDIRRDNQYFTYRESPTPVDGLAKIKSIKGNTLVWNQLHQNQNGRSETDQYSYMLNVGSNFRVPSGHKLLVFFTQPTGCEVYATSRTGISVAYQLFPSVTTPTVRSFIGTTTGTLEGGLMDGTVCLNNAVSSAVQLTNCMVFDLTQMGLDITDPSEFTSIFSLPYYAYNQGSLLSFNGTGLKTVGKNLINANESYTFNPTLTPIPVYLEANKAYTVSYEVNVAGLSLDTQFRNADNNQSIVHQPLNTVTGQRMSVTMTPTEPVYGLRFYVNGQITVSNIQIEYGSTATDYEPYTSHTINLPISTYFPTGMASAKNAYSNTMVYDELLPTKAIKRLVQYTFTGNETVSGITNLGTYYRCYIPIAIPSKGTYATRWEKNVPNVYNYTEDSSHYYVQNSQFWYFTTSSTAQAIIDELRGTKLYYDLATPVELPTMSFE